MSGPSAYRAAIGPKDGDSLELRNQWARVTITYSRDMPPRYVVTGDLYDLRAREKDFPTMRRALDYAMESLAVYQEGRAS
jgi:hypothetical protein